MANKYIFGFLQKTTEPSDSELLIGGTGAAPDYNFTWGNMVAWLTTKLFNRNPVGDQKGCHLIPADFDFTNIPVGYDNSIWEIRYEHDLLTDTIIIPTGVELNFKGGYLRNGVITGDDTKITSGLNHIFDTTLSLVGSWVSKEASFRWFGALGNNIDDTIAINDTIKFIENNDGGVISIGKGIFNSTGITLPNVGMSIIGDNAGMRSTNSILKFIQTDGDNCISSVVNRTKSIALKGFKVEANNLTGHGVDISSNGEAYSEFRNVWVQSAGGDGFHFENVFISRFNNLTSEACLGNGIYGSNVNECEFIGVDLTRAGLHGMHIIGSVANTIIGNTDNTGLSGVYIESGQSNSIKTYHETSDAVATILGVELGIETTGNEVTTWESRQVTIKDLGLSNTITDGRGNFETDIKRLKNNTLNNGFESGLDSAVVFNWSSGSGATYLNDDSGAITSNRSMKVTYPVGTSDVFEFSSSIPNMLTDEKLYVEFWIKADREISQTNLTGEYLQFELIGMPNASPNTFFTVYADSEWRRYRAVFTATEDSTNTRARFKMIQAASSVVVNIADLVFTRDLSNRGGNLYGSKTYDPIAAGDGNAQSTTVQVDGARIGDFAQASFGVPLQGMIMTAWVEADNLVTVWMQNETGESLDLPSSTLRVMVEKWD